MVREKLTKSRKFGIVNATGKAIPLSRLQKLSSRAREQIKKNYAKVDSNSMQNNNFFQYLISKHTKIVTLLHENGNKL